MRAIIVDDEPLMLKRFLRLSEGIPDLNVVGEFESAQEALRYAGKNQVELAFLDVAMPAINGIELAKKLREIRRDILIVFVSAYEEYIWDSNRIGGDYYIIKPYNRETLEMAMERIRLMSHRQRKELYIQTFGRFVVLRDGKPLRFTGKAKEILALVVSRRGREISNERLYSIIWEDRPYSNENMNVFYNALSRLKRALKDMGEERLLISSAHGQMLNTEIVDCDYYDWLDKNVESRNRFVGDFMSEYTWGETVIAEMVRDPRWDEADSRKRGRPRKA